MAYAQPSDMVTRFGQAEMLRLSAPEGQPLDVIDLDRVNLALGDASAVIDSYLRRRYATPVATVPQELTRACCALARYDLSLGDGRAPSDQVAAAQKQAVAWLEGVRDGKILLADATPAGEQSFAQVKVRAGAAYGGIGAPPPATPDPNAGYPELPFLDQWT